ncbi:hypothetical protein P6144_09235 [Sphingomonas sp. HITSZ_GF]|uniref:hypothetical protein n=1 Tax=Sphingomonas sp. HITSZ_GF TaxID=3037247 RepID=UPI00240D6441|nr:hypothetical protein [Sphingomonas sp. HITSZ_GF]MDG2533828.1 hypothetical protein [Sphingomonas sp. HITSZ_GF]
MRALTILLPPTLHSLSAPGQPWDDPKWLSWGNVFMHCSLSIPDPNRPSPAGPKHRRPLAPDDPLARETRTLALSRAMGRINQKFGRNAVSVGPLQGGRIDRAGTKIAFGRIPEMSEFHE